MDATTLVFLAATFVGGVVTGLAGFAFGLVVSGIWLQILTPAQSAALIVGFGIVVQLYALHRLRGTIPWRTVIPTVIGGAAGVPAGALSLSLISPAVLRFGVGILLICYSLYGLLRPQVHRLPSNRPAEVALGFVNGWLGGMTGLSGVFITVWCGLRGWPRDTQRAVYQPVILAAFLMTGAWFAATGTITTDTMRLFAYGLPVLLAGVVVGYRLYGRLDEQAFRRVVLLLLLASGAVLILPFR